MTITKTALGGLSDWAEESIINFGYHTGYGTVLLDGTYIAGGWTLAPSDINSKLSTVVSYVINPVQGYDFVWDHANSKLKAYAREYGANAEFTGTITHNATPSSVGRALYVNVIHAQSRIGYFNADNSDSNADAFWAVGQGGPTAFVDDNNSTPAGVQVYLDEDAAYGSRLQCVSPNANDLYVPMSYGGYIRIKHDSAAASNGVAVYFDDNATNNWERMFFASPTTTSQSLVLPTMPIAGLNGVTLKIKVEGY